MMLNLKSKAKKVVLGYVNKPTKDIISSQTIYETIFYINNKDENFKKNHYEIAIKKLIETQLDDGGYDIGYDFQFGPNMKKTKKKEGTSPEQLSLVALCIAASEYPARNDILQSIEKSYEWITRRLIKNSQGIAIPYAPDSYKYIHITNATSFCISAVAHAINFLDEEKKLIARKNVEGMCEFMLSQLVVTNTGAYWPYFYQNGSKTEAKLVNNKIDNYHIAQQLYHHCLTHKICDISSNKKIIESVSEYLLSLVEDDGYVPYTVFNSKRSDKIHLWGFASLIPAFVQSYLILKDNRHLEAALKVATYIEKYAVASDYFYPIVSHNDKKPLDKNFYPRSDAWVIHALSELEKIGSLTKKLTEISEKSFKKILLNDFKGLENHVLTYRMKIFASLIRIIYH